METTPVLSIGSILGGRSESTDVWNGAIRLLSQRVIAARKGASSPLNVNVVFQVPGHVLSPDFTGIRTGRFSRKASLLMIQLAIPDGLPIDAQAFVSRALMESIDEAEAWAKKRRVASDLDLLRKIGREATRGE